MYLVWVRWTALILAVLVVVGCRSRAVGPEERYPIKGKVVNVDKRGSAVTIAHEPIPGYMEAMTMPFKLKDPSMLDVMTGQVEVVFGTLIQALPHVRSGKLKPLGVGSAKRSPILPQVQAIAETLPGYDGTIWWGILAPAGVPAPVVTKLNGEINAILKEPEMAKRLTAEAAEPVITTPDAFGKLIQENITKWSRIAKEANIRAE